MPRPDGSLTDAEDASAWHEQWKRDNPEDPKAKTWDALMRAIGHSHGGNLVEALQRLHDHAADVPADHAVPAAKVESCPDCDWLKCEKCQAASTTREEADKG